MTASELLADLRRRGFSVTLAGDALHVSPRSALSSDLRAAIVTHKPALVAILASESWNDATADSLIDATFRAIAEAYQQDRRCTDPSSSNWAAVEEAINAACFAEDMTALLAACGLAWTMVSSVDSTVVDRSASSAELTWRQAGPPEARLKGASNG